MLKNIKHIKISFQDKRRLFQELFFYNMFIEKPRIKHLKNRDLLHELTFYDKISIKQISEAFKRCARSYKT